MNTNATTDLWHDYYPQVTTDGAGHWVAVWQFDEDLSSSDTEYDIFVARSTDNGATWTAPALLNANGTTDSRDDEVPQVATDGAGNWVAVWSSNQDLSGVGTDWEIFVARSTDNGEAWTAPAFLNTNATTDPGSDYCPQVTTDGSGHWVTVWSSKEDLSGAGWDLDIFVARSTDHGATWTFPALLNGNATTDSGYDGSPQITTDGAGHWVAVWESDEPDIGAGIGTDYDILFSTSFLENVLPQVSSATAMDSTTVRVVFDEDMMDDAALVNPDNYTFIGSAALTAASVARIDGTTVDVNVNEMTHGAAYTAYVETGPAGPTNLVSTHVDPAHNSAGFTGVGVAPTATLSLLGPSPTGADAVEFEVAFDEAVAPTFEPGDVSVTGTLTGSAGVSGTDPTYTVTVTLDDADADGTVGIDVAGGGAVTDLAGNPYAGGASPLCDVFNWRGFISGPENTQAYTGDTVTFTVVPDCGASTLSYQWKWDDGSKAVHDGPTTPSWGLSGVAPANAGDYWCEVTYEGTMHESAHATLSVQGHLEITQHPVGADSDAGDSHTFSVATSGGFEPIRYQWFKDSVAIVEETDATLYLDSLIQEDSGTYKVQVMDDYEDVLESDPAELRVSAGLPAAGAIALAFLAAASVACGAMITRRRH